MQENQTQNIRPLNDKSRGMDNGTIIIGLAMALFVIGIGIYAIYYGISQVLAQGTPYGFVYVAGGVFILGFIIYAFKKNSKKKS